MLPRFKDLNNQKLLTDNEDELFVAATRVLSVVGEAGHVGLALVLSDSETIHQLGVRGELESALDVSQVLALQENLVGGFVWTEIEPHLFGGLVDVFRELGVTTTEVADFQSHELDDSIPELHGLPRFQGHDSDPARENESHPLDSPDFVEQGFDLSEVELAVFHNTSFPDCMSEKFSLPES